MEPTGDLTMRSAEKSSFEMKTRVSAGEPAVRRNPNSNPERKKDSESGRGAGGGKATGGGG